MTEILKLYSRPKVVLGLQNKLDHTDPHLLSAMNNLAVLLDDLGERAEARAKYEAVVAGYTAQLGPDHTSTLTAKMNLAILIGTSDRETALQMFVDCVAGFTAKLGPDHQSTKNAQQGVDWLSGWPTDPGWHGPHLSQRP